MSKAIDKAARREYVLAARDLGLGIPGNSLHDWTKAEHSPGDEWWGRFKAVLSEEDWRAIERRVIAHRRGVTKTFNVGAQDIVGERQPFTEPATDDARRWQGWGTALKPAHEPIVVARKPLVGTVAANVLVHGTGALNIDACRIEGPLGSDGRSSQAPGLAGATVYGDFNGRPSAGDHPESVRHNAVGRWPANVALLHADGCARAGTKRVRSGEAVRERSGGSTFGGDAPKPPMENLTYAGEDGTETVEAWECAPCCPVAALDAQSGELSSGSAHVLLRGATTGKGMGYGSSSPQDSPAATIGDRGGASRFFYCAKAARSEREVGLLGKVSCAKCGGLDTLDHPAPTDEDPERRAACVRNDHPTVKPIEVMRWLLRLVTPPGGVLLDPFAGSGTTLCAGELEGIAVVGIERDGRSAAIAEARHAHWALEAEREARLQLERGEQLSLGDEAA